MALRDQPYLPLYIQDIMTDEKLNECSAATHGIFIKGIMCLMHKSDQYGKILLQQKDKQNTEQIKNFAVKIAKHTPYSIAEVEQAIQELLREKVCYLEGDFLCQKRMIEDNQLSEIRAKAGKKAKKGSKDLPPKRPKKFATHFAPAKQQANTEYESDTVGEPKTTVLKGGAGGNEIVLPFQTPAFAEHWQRWLDYRISIKKPYLSKVSEQMALKQLSQFDEPFSIHLIETSIANGWQGLIFGKTKQEFNESKHSKGGTVRPINKSGVISHNADQLERVSNGSLKVGS